MRNIRRQVTSTGWIAPARVLVRGIPRTPPGDLGRVIAGTPPRAVASISKVPQRALVVGVPRAILEDRYDVLVTREFREPIARLTTLGATIVAIGMAVGYQLLMHWDAVPSLTRWRARWHWPRTA